MPLCVKCQLQYADHHVCEICLEQLREIARCRKGHYYQINPNKDQGYGDKGSFGRTLNRPTDLFYPVEGYIRKPYKRYGRVDGYQVWHKMERALSWGDQMPAEIPIIHQDLYARDREFERVLSPEAFADYEKAVKEFSDKVGRYYYSRHFCCLRNFCRTVKDVWDPGDDWWELLTLNIDPPQKSFSHYFITVSNDTERVQDSQQVKLHEFDTRLTHLKTGREFLPVLQGIIQSCVLNIV